MPAIIFICAGITDTFHDQVNEAITSFYYQYSDDEIVKIAENIQPMSETPKEKYNLILLIMIVPAKYTIKHNVSAPYDNYALIRIK